MIQGLVVNGVDATLRLRIAGPSGQQLEISTIIDTGFTGALTLPREEIDALNLRPLGFRTAVLADGERSVLRMFEATVIWDGKDRTVQVLESQGVSLAGMAMLRGFRLTIDVVENGTFTIESVR